MLWNRSKALSTPTLTSASGRASIAIASPIGGLRLLSSDGILGLRVFRPCLLYLSLVEDRKSGGSAVRIGSGEMAEPASI